MTGPFSPNWIHEVESWRYHVELPWSTPARLSHASQDWSQLEFSLEFSFQTALTRIKWEEEKGGHIRLEWNSTFPLDCFSVTNPTCWQIKPTAPKFHKQMRGSKKFKSPFSNSLTSPAKRGNIDMAFPHEPALRAKIFSWLRRCKKPTVSLGGERRFLRQDKDTYYRTVGPTNCSRNDRSHSRLHPPLATDFCYFSAIFPLFPSASFPPGFSQIHANGSGRPSKKLEIGPVIVQDCGGSGEELRRWHRILGLQSV